ncbi:hypothetical protein GCM10022395_15610 [Snuella lapsa]|uniref:Polysaccharide biosynthesis protein CapD-like domain-containing protein n=1 Tax=Snuella lapsa TaxID=870481 RepID=A0ABP6XER2_9FLAO
MPKLPSYRITDLAEAISPDCKKPIVGIRPGEKIHEEMIAPADAFCTYDLGNFYVILPPNPNWEVEEFVKIYKAKKVNTGFSYNSGENTIWETVESLKALVSKV